MTELPRVAQSRTRTLARVLLVDDDPRARLTLKTVLEAGGYCVKTAASAAEATDVLRSGEFELVLSDLHMESPEAGLNVLAQARAMRYRPATAIVNSYCDHPAEPGWQTPDLLIGTEDLAGLLGHVAQLISRRASRQVAREMRAAAFAGAS